MPMNKKIASLTIANLRLIKDKSSDFKIELGRLKDEFTNAIDALIKYHLDDAIATNNKFSINLYSDVDRSIKYFTKKEEAFDSASMAINRLLDSLGLDSNLKIRLSDDDHDIYSFIETFILEYGLIKFYKNTKDQILLDFDNIYNSPEATAAMAQSSSRRPPNKTPPISSNESLIFAPEDESEEEEEEEDEEEEEEEEEKHNLTAEERMELEEAYNSDELPDSEILSETDARYNGDYYIRSFFIKFTIKKNNRSVNIKYFGAVSPDGKWVCSKKGLPIYGKTEIRVENRVKSNATQVLNVRPNQFSEWITVGGAVKHTFYDNLPEIGVGKGKSSEKSGDSSRITMNQAVIAHNLNYSSHFFLREEVSLARKFDLVEENMKKNLKTDLNLFSALLSIYPAFSNLNNQDMILYIDETSLPHKLVIDKKISAEFDNFVFSKISESNSALSSAYSSAANSMDISIAEKARYDASKKIDDLLSACKIRDRIIYDKFLSLKNDISNKNISSFDFESINRLNIEDILICNSFKSGNTKLGIALFNFAQVICFASSTYINSFAARMVRNSTVNGDAQKLFLDEKLIDQAFSQFNKLIGTQISSKIANFFNISSTDSTSTLFCRYISSSIRLEFLYRTAYNYAAKPVRLGWNYISCPTCKKDIYYSKYKETPSGVKSDIIPLITSNLKVSQDKAEAYIDATEMSDYDEERYSFFKPNGEIITTQELRSFGQQSGKNWDDILRMISSNNQVEHNTGVRERQSLLKSMGAKVIKRKGGRGAAAVFSYKTKCPFSALSLPASLQHAKDSSGKQLTISDFSCGLSLNVDELLSSDKKIQPYELQSSVYDAGVDPELKLNEAINSSIERGQLVEEDRQKFINELSTRRSGGWKFSNLMFKCPCKPTGEVDVGSGIFQYVASPISGFFKNDLYQKGLIHPPSTESGDLSSIDDYTASYLVCGNITSISSFCRDTSDSNSLYGILKTKLRESLVNSNRESALYLSNFIDTLLQLGVDFNDILPFIDRAYSEEIGAKISSSHKKTLDSIIKNAADMDLFSHEKDSGLSRAQILGDLKLVCSHGHRFKIIDSIKFGQTHIGHSSRLKNSVSYRGYRASALSNLIKKSGIDNLNATLSTEIPGNNFGQTILVRVNKSQISSNMKNFTDWDGIWDKDKGISNLYYVDGNNNYYVFGAASNEVLWGDPQKLESSTPFIKKDKRTELLIRTNSLEISDSPSDSEEGGSAPTLTDKIQTEEYSSTITSLTVNTMAHERAKLDIYYSPVGVILQTALRSIKDFCDEATSLEISAPLYGTPVSLANEDKIIPLVKDIIGKVYLRQAEQGGADELESAKQNLSNVIEDGFNFFSKNFLDKIKIQDLRFLNMLGPSMSPLETDNIAKNIALAVTTAVEIHEGGESRYDPYFLKDLSSRMYDPELKAHIQNEIFSPDLFQKVEDIGKMIKSNVEPTKKTTMTGLISGDEKPSISELQGSEYIGRVMMMSSALFLADSISMLYKKYLSNTSPNYIGVNIGIDLSSPSNIISVIPSSDYGSIFAIPVSKISSIPTSFPIEQFMDDISEDGEDSELLEYLQDIDAYKEYFIDGPEVLAKKLNQLLVQNKDAIAIRRTRGELEQRKSFKANFEKWAENFIDEYVSEISEFLETIKTEMSKLNIACTSYKYTQKSVELIRQSLLTKIELYKTTDPSIRKITSAIVNRCVTNSPFTTISLAAGDKYHAYYAGNEQGDVPRGGPFRFLPLFNADVVSVTGVPEHAPPIFIISSSRNSYSNLGVQFSQAAPAKKHVVLFKDIVGDFIEPYPTTLPEDIILSGWKTGLIDSKKFPVEYKKDISLFYHPYTLAVLSDGSRIKPSFDDKISGFINNHTHYNSISGFHLGQQATRSGVLSLYPTPYAHNDKVNNGGTHFGILLPVEYGKGLEKLEQGYVRLAPFFDARIPVELPTDSPGNVIRINVSDFLVRDPPDRAEQILSEISKRYVEYKELEKRVKTSDEKKKLRDQCKKDTAELFDLYRHLPYRVTNAPSSSCVKYVGALGEANPVVLPSVTAYIPMADYITCNKILSYEEFSPEFGGHSFWEEGDTASIPAVKGAIEQMVINSGNLEELSLIMNSQLNDDEIKITAQDLLDPHSGVFNKIYQKVKKDIMSRTGSKDSSQVISETIKNIRRITGYNIEDDYTPIASVDKNLSEKLKYQYRTDIFWGKVPHDKRYKYLDDAAKKFGTWLPSISRSYLIRSGESNQNGEPTARIKVMSEMFPFNSEGGTGRVLDLQNVQDPNSKKIISPKDFNYSGFLYGTRHTTDKVFFPGGTPEEEAKALKELKKFKGQSMTVSAVKYAAAISDFFISNIVEGLRGRIQIEKERDDISTDVKSIRPISKSASALKNTFIKVRVAPEAAVDNIRKAGMISLLSTFTK